MLTCCKLFIFKKGYFYKCHLMKSKKFCYNIELIIFKSKIDIIKKTNSNKKIISLMHIRLTNLLV